jgi:4-hydroxybenzoate polyprenyltransferase
MLACLLALVGTFGLGPLGWVAVAVVASLIAYEHRLVHADDLSRVDAAFFTMNGWVSVLFFVFVTADIFLLRYGI